MGRDTEFCNPVWVPCYFGKRWDYRDPILRFKEIALFGQVDDYLDNTVWWDEPRVFWWMRDEELRDTIVPDIAEYMYDEMYSDYPLDEIFDEEEPFGFALGIRANLMDARGFTYIKYAPKANPSLRLGYESYKDIAARTSKPVWTAPSTGVKAFSLLRFYF